ncbi:TetR/AcrR family transcriptional regulator [Gulosibacter sp. 10]|uniref:TetR/AcrR family transcriptional regulator n=1 Tax=Gulosibacter sp. 10 TaxID=1255570 RepID=UPI00097F19D6|nr:TetR/AcrR family transcriptional regulator [Gulosibacter sp. 10]SJM68909.1 Transcriptional regulator, TetR family [Gulosibacter sp. 10]
MDAVDREFAERVFGTRLRADAAAKAFEILRAADRLLRADPAATLEEIASAAGAARTTVYRRFPTRNDLLVALSRWAVGRIASALEDAQIGAVAPEEALHRATRNAIEAKTGLAYARTLPPADDPLVAESQARIRELAGRLVAECADAGVIDADADPEWVLAVFYALVHEASVGPTADDADADALSRRVVDTLLRGVGPTAR